MPCRLPRQDRKVLVLQWCPGRRPARPALRRLLHAATRLRAWTPTDLVDSLRTSEADTSILRQNHFRGRCSLRASSLLFFLAFSAYCLMSVALLPAKRRRRFCRASVTSSHGVGVREGRAGSRENGHGALGCAATGVVMSLYSGGTSNRDVFRDAKFSPNSFFTSHFILASIQSSLHPHRAIAEATHDDHEHSVSCYQLADMCNFASVYCCVARGRRASGSGL